MASTLTLTNSLNFVTPILKGQRLNVINQEPGVRCANLVLDRMLGAPCRWRQNRATFTFPTVITSPPTTDYKINVPLFGWMENQWALDPEGNIYPLTGSLSLSRDASAIQRPSAIAPQYDDNNGNITFRLDKPSDQIYQISGDYQKKAPLIQSFGDTWGPMPDEFGHVFDMGFLALCSLLVNDPRMQIYDRWFISGLLGLQDGLSEQQKDIIIGDWMNKSATIARSQGAVNAGLSGRST